MSVFNACVKPFFATLALLFSAVLWAEEKKITPPDPLAASGKVVFFLVLIIGLIFLLAWLVNKTRMVGQGNAGLKSASGLRMVAVLSLGLKEKIAVVQVGDKQLVVGITPQQITLLSELAEPLPVAEASSVSFSELLKKAIQK